MTRRQLDFAVIGAQKCATSWLYYCLKDHPGIAVPETKHELGYIGGAIQREKGEDWFFDRFDAAPGQAMGDVSVEYLWDTAAARPLHAHMADGGKLIVSLRHPVDRTVSGYFWHLRKGDLPNKPLEEGLAPILEAKPGFPDPIAPPLGNAVERSLYAGQLQSYIDVFGAQDVKVVLYEDVAEDGLAVVQDIYRYLGVDDGFVPPSLNAAPKKNSYNRVLLAIENSTQSKVVAKLCNWAHQGLTMFSQRKDILPRDIRRRLNRLFAPTVDDTVRVLAQLPESQRPTEARIRQAWKLD